MGSGVVQKAKANPMMTGIIAFVTLATGGSALWNGFEWLDSVHTTEFELAEYDKTAHPVSHLAFTDLKDQLADAQVVSKCRWLKSEMRALEDAIYVRKRDKADPDYIHDLEQDLARIEANLGKDLLDHAPGHELQQLRVGDALGVHRIDMAAVTQHSDAVPDAADLAHAVGDVDDADPSCPQPGDQLKELVRLVIRQRCSRFVQDQNGEF